MLTRLLSTSALLLSLTILPSPALFGQGTPSWETVASRMAGSVVRVESTVGEETAICTAFSINEAKHYFMTATHCAGIEMKLDGVEADTDRIILEDVEADIMIVAAKDLDRPALVLAKRDVRVGQPIAALGYAWGMALPAFRTGVASILGLIGPWDEQRYTVADFAFIGGMSGGPVVDQNGRVVSIVQLGTDGAGMGRTLDVLRKLTGEYWSTAPALPIPSGGPDQ